MYGVFLCCWLWCIIKKWKKRGICVKMRWKNKKEVKATASKKRTKWKLNELLISLCLCWFLFALRLVNLTLSLLLPPTIFTACRRKKMKNLPAADVTYMIQRIFMFLCFNATFFVFAYPRFTVARDFYFRLLQEAVISLRDLSFISSLRSPTIFFLFIVKWKIYRFSPSKKKKLVTEEWEGKNYGKKGFSPRDSLMMENLCLH